VRDHFKAEFFELVEYSKGIDSKLYESARKALGDIKHRRTEILEEDESALVVGVDVWGMIDDRIRTFFIKVRENIPVVRIDENKRFKSYLDSIPEFIHRSKQRTEMIVRGMHLHIIA